MGCPRCGGPVKLFAGAPPLKHRCLRCGLRFAGSGTLSEPRAARTDERPATLLRSSEIVARAVLYVVFGIPLVLSFLGLPPAIISGQWTRALISFSTLVFCCAPIAVAKYRTRTQGVFTAYIIILIGAVVGGFIGYHISTTQFGLAEGNMLLPGIAAGGFVGFTVGVSL